MIDILATLIPVCPDCNRCLVRRDWNTARPKAACGYCGKVHYYAPDGRIVLSAVIRKAVAA